MSYVKNQPTFTSPLHVSNIRRNPPPPLRRYPKEKDQPMSHEAEATTSLIDAYRDAIVARVSAWGNGTDPYDQAAQRERKARTALLDAVTHATTPVEEDPPVTPVDERPDLSRSTQGRLIKAWYAAIKAGYTFTVPAEARCRKCPRPHMPYSPVCSPCGRLIGEAERQVPAAKITYELLNAEADEVASL